MSHSKKIVMFGATGAVGNHTALILAKQPAVKQLTLLGRKAALNIASDTVIQHQIDIFTPTSYVDFLTGHDTAICTLGVGQPSTISKDEFIKIDKDAVLNFATACKIAGINHFELLSSVGVSTASSSFYLRTKGELEAALMALEFDRLSLFHPSMIITPTNRYGISQAIALALVPFIDPLLIGSMNKFRSISAARLGTAIAMNLFQKKQVEGVRTLHWRDFLELSKTPPTDN